MRRLTTTLTAILMVMLCCSFASAQRFTISGRIVDDQAKQIPYATVVLLEEGDQASGGVTDSEGNFSLVATAGSYQLHVSYIGYKSISKEISIEGDLALGAILLEEDSANIDEVVVTAQLIRREADRFVVDVANSPIAMGKDGEELLKSAPGVWIQDDKISINGSSGAKIYLNDREVKMEDEQLIAYLRSLRAEEIQRI